MNKIKTLTLLLVTLAPLLLFSQKTKDKREIAKQEREMADRMQGHIQYLTASRMSDRSTSSDAEILAAQYISNWFGQAGLEPTGGSGFLQEFRMNVGKQALATENSFEVDGKEMVLGADFHPLQYSANIKAYGSSSLTLREKNQPWFFDLEEVYARNEGVPNIDIHKAIKKEVETIIAKGATALIVYNTSDNVLTDSMLYNYHASTSSYTIPVVYVTKEGMDKYFPDESEIYNINIKVNIMDKYNSTRNVVGYIDNKAPQTVVIGAHYDNASSDKNAKSDNNSVGMAVCMELAVALNKSTLAKKNNYVFIGFSGEAGLYGSKYWFENSNLKDPINYMMNLDLGNIISNTVMVSGFKSSSVGADLLSSIKATNINIMAPSGTDHMQFGDHVSFYRNGIPVFCFNSVVDAATPKTTVDYNSLRGIIKYLVQLVETADGKGKFAFTDMASTNQNAKQ